MKRREFLKSISSTAMITATLSLNGCFKIKRKPNVLLIVTDDQGYADIGCSGLTDDVSTPNIDALAKNGTRFTNAYATSPICSPSRIGIMTGTYNQRFGTYWYGGNGIHNNEYKTIAEILKQNEYSTGYVGKVHYGSNDSNINDRNFPNNHGFDYYYGHTSPRKHYLSHNAAKEEEFQRVKKESGKWGQSLRQEPMWHNKNKEDVEGFTTEMFAEKACDFIFRNKENPFYLHLSFNAVHNFTHQLPQDYLEKHNLQGYHDWDPASEDYYEWYQKGRYPNNPEGRQQYLGQLYYLDKAIGKVINHLKKCDVFDNTLIFFISDNGGSTPIYANNFPLRGSKYTLYEGGIRVPMIIAWDKKYKKNQVCDNIISGMDILPTICTACGLQIPHNIDGIDISDLLLGKNNSLEHDVLFWDTGSQIAVRNGKWKLRIATEKKSQDYEMVELELGEYLYDLEKDISEKVNLTIEFPEVVGRLKKLHNEWKNSVNIE